MRFLEYKMATVDQVHLDVLQVLLVRFRARNAEEGIVLAPDDQRSRLVLLEVRMPLGVSFEVTLVLI